MKPPPTSGPSAVIRPRLYLSGPITIGPGKIDLLRKVDETHSISAAARALGMSYKHAWVLIDSLNEGFRRPIVETATGGRGGGGTVLTALGKQLVECYVALEARVNSAAQAELDALVQLTRQLT
jgi:molybdate transport system regulatory protein